MSNHTPERLMLCPFCNGKAQYNEDPANGRWIECSECKACTLCFFPLKQCVNQQLKERWNDRQQYIEGIDDVEGFMEDVKLIINSEHIEDGDKDGNYFPAICRLRHALFPKEKK